MNNEVKPYYIDPLNKTYKVKCCFCGQPHQHGQIPKNGDVKLSHCLGESKPYIIRTNITIFDGIQNQDKIQNDEEIQPKDDISSSIRQKRKYIKRLKHNLL